MGEQNSMPGMTSTQKMNQRFAGTGFADGNRVQPNQRPCLDRLIKTQALANVLQILGLPA